MVASAIDYVQELDYDTARGPGDVLIAEAEQLLPIDSSLYHPLATLSPGDLGFQFNKNLTQVKTGSVRSTKQTHLDEWEGMIGFKSLSMQPLINQVSMGTGMPIDYTAATSAWADTVDASISTERQIIPVTTGTFTNLAKNDRVTIEHGPTGYKKKYLGIIAAMDAASTPKTITLKHPLKFVPASGDAITKVEDYIFKIGGDTVKDYTVLAQYSLNNDELFQVHAQKVQFTGNLSKENTAEGLKTGAETIVLSQAETISGFANQQTVLVTCKCKLPAS